MNTTQTVSDVFTECYLRDNYTCQDCGSKEKLEIHHILPVSQGGQNTLDNLKVVCFKCHRENYKEVHFPKDKTKIIPYEKRVKNRSGIDKNKFKQVMFGLSPEMLEMVETFQFDNRIKSRTEAIRILIQKGLEKEN